jgi:hypothetical protein
MPATLLPCRDCSSPSGASNTSRSHSRRASRLSVQLLKDHIRDPLQSLQKFKNLALKRHSQVAESSERDFVNFPNTSFYNSLADPGLTGRDSPRFERKTPTRYEAIQQHNVIEFRQRFLALPQYIRNQIYDEVLMHRLGHHSHASHYHYPTGRFVYTHNGGGFPGGTLVLQSETPQPNHLQYIREGDHLWQELFDRWLSGADCETSQVLDFNPLEFTYASRDSINSLYPVSPGFSTSIAFTKSEACSIKGMELITHRFIRSCTLNISFHGIDFDFAQAAQDPYSSSLYTSISQITRYLTSILETVDLRFVLALWPGKYMEYSDHGWCPFFESEADVEGLWSLLKPLKSIPGIQSIQVKRLNSTILWSRQPNSLYPEDPPLVVVERAGVSINGWLDWDKGWLAGWQGFEDLLTSAPISQAVPGRAGTTSTQHIKSSLLI